MTTSYMTIIPHDPVIVRDARPFGEGARMKSLPWPYPSVLAGSVRTMLGKQMEEGFSPNIVQALKEISISGPFPSIRITENERTRAKLFLPAPRDILKEEKNDGTIQYHAIRPCLMEELDGCTLPCSGFIPAMISKSAGTEFKPAEIPPFWSIETMTEWLTDPSGNSFSLPESLDTKDPRTLEFPEKDSRIHVGIDPKLGSSQDGMLFETVGLDYVRKGDAPDIEIAAKIKSNGKIITNTTPKECFHPFGGERRLSSWQTVPGHEGWECPDKILKAVTSQTDVTHIRMVLATPAIFSEGWLPGWLKLSETGLAGRPPGASEDVTLQLVSACVGRWLPLSGWSLETRGPKPIRRMVPVGSVYFFILHGNAEEFVKKFWLKPVCDETQDNRDGFGLACWGIWESEVTGEELRS